MEILVESSRPSCDEDYVLVYDVGHTGNLKQLDRVCNVKVPMAPLYSSWSKMKLIFNIDDAFTNRGFMAKYQSKTFQIPDHLLQDIHFDGEFCQIVIVIPCMQRCHSLWH